MWVAGFKVGNGRPTLPAALSPGRSFLFNLEKQIERGVKISIFGWQPKS